MSTKTRSKIDQYLSVLKDKHDGILPYGTYAEIAKKYNMSREWVRQRAKKLAVSVNKLSRIRLCDYCGKEFRANSKASVFCSRKCFRAYFTLYKHQLVLCDCCGLGILVKKSDLERSITKKFYCSRKCYSRSDHLKNIAGKLTKKYGKNYFTKIGVKGNKVLKEIRSRHN